MAWWGRARPGSGTRTHRCSAYYRYRMNTFTHRHAPPPVAADAFVKDMVSKLPLGRVGEPSDIANLAGFLADASKSGWITGSNFVGDGGALVRSL